MSVRDLARTSNDFESSPRAIQLEALRTTAEVAALLRLNLRTLRSRAARRGIEPWRGSRRPAYWTPEQVERLRGGS